MVIRTNIRDEAFSQFDSFVKKLWKYGKLPLKLLVMNSDYPDRFAEFSISQILVTAYQTLILIQFSAINLWHMDIYGSVVIFNH